MSKESTESASRDKSNVLVKGSTHLTLCTPDSGTGSVLERAIESYIEQAPQQLKILREALATGNAESLANVAQILKSASATLGALGNSTRCTALEQAGGKNAQDSANITLKENHDDMPREGEVPLDVVGAGQHIWLVDDDASFQEATATALRSAGFQVTITENGDQVLSMSHHSRPDLVLLGAIMEG